MKIWIGCDHAGYERKQEVIALLKERQLEVEDCGPCPQVGDIVDFDVIYLTMLYASAREDVAVKFVD